MLLRLLDRWRCPAPDPGRVSWLAGREFAHRGLHGDGAPENSPAAFARALDRGLGIECDIQRSADGRAMVFHDWTLDRLTGETGPVSARKVGELTAIPLKGGADTIPTLRDLLAQVGGRVPLLIEVKSRADLRVEGICLSIRRELEGYAGACAVMSFDARVPEWFRRYAPHVLRGLVVTEENARTMSGKLGRHRAMWQARAEFLAYDIRDLPASFAAAQRKRGLPVLTWTVRSPELRERAALHADGPIAEAGGFA